MTNNMKAKLSVILSLISILGVISVWGLWLFESLELAVVSLDTFIGVIVALLAIIVTVAIGYQIINAIEVKDEIKQLKQRQDIILENERKLLENEQSFGKLADNLQAGISFGDAASYYDKNQYIEAFVFYHVALSFSTRADTPNLLERIKLMRGIIKLIFANEKPVISYVKLKQQIISDIEIIRNTAAYRNYLGEEYETMMLEFWDKMKQIGLENEITMQ